MTFEQRLVEVQGLVNKLMTEHGISHWAFAYDRSKIYYGTCYPKKKKITLSKYFCGNSDNDLLDIQDTILHEIAHAIASERYPNIRHGHDEVWRQIALDIGCRDPRRCSNKGEMPKGKFQAFCPRCGDLPLFMHRMGKAMKQGRYRCKKCRSPLGWRK